MYQLYKATRKNLAYDLERMKGILAEYDQELNIQSSSSLKELKKMMKASKKEKILDVDE